jgi:hypothetical protein
MLDLVGAARGIAGAWRLARLDAGGMGYFDATVAGFWRSFQAAVVAAPLFVLLILLRTAEHPLSPDPLRAFFIEAIGYTVGWTAFPLAAWYLASALDRTARYFGYIVAYNWANVIQVAAFVPIAALSASDLLPDAFVVVIALLLTAAVIYYQYFIVRTALAVEALPALGFVAIDLMLGLLIDAVETALHARGVVSTSLP